MDSVQEVLSSDDLKNILGSSLKLILVHFWTEWAPECQQMDDVLQELIKDKEYRDVQFLKLKECINIKKAYVGDLIVFVKENKIQAENLTDVSLKYSISSVPSFIFFKNKEEVERLEGANVPELMKKLKLQLSRLYIPQTTAIGGNKEDLNSRLERLINEAPCMLFMKGNSEEPKCGFSRQVIELLNKHNANFKTFNILEDEEIRQGLKEYSKWPTYPQLYINGDLIGGLDILKEMSESGDLDSMLPKVTDLNQRIKELINKSPVMVFMKGSQDIPRCGFSKTLITILNDEGVKYETFDILQDEEVRQELKIFSNWPTYPQVYVKGNLIGGLDIIKELKESGELNAALQGEH